MRIAPGDVAKSIAAQQAGGEQGSTVDLEEIEQIREALGLNEPLYIQYWVWISGFVRGDWGDSLFTRRPVFDEFKQKAAVTFELVILSQIMAIAIGLPAGVLMALKQDSKIDYSVRIGSLAGTLYSIVLERHPASGRRGVLLNVEPALGVFRPDRRSDEKPEPVYLAISHDRLHQCCDEGADDALHDA